MSEVEPHTLPTSPHPGGEAGARMVYDITHVTTFDYDSPMQYARCNLRLQPINWPGQHVVSFGLEVTPETPISLNRVSPYIGHISRVVIDKPVTKLVITARSRLEVERTAAEVLPDDPGVARVAEAARGIFDLSMKSPANYIYPSPMIPLTEEITAWCGESLAADRGIVAACYELNTRIRDAFKYDPEATDTNTTPAQAFALRAGVCQDFAQVMIAGMRAHGIPTAYVSGYLRTLPPPGKPRLVGADATHAWVIVWCGAERGWIGFDPTNGIGMNADHILTAIGRDYADIAPIDGIFVGQAGQTINVSVDVCPVEGV